MNRPVRTRMPGGVGGGASDDPAYVRPSWAIAWGCKSPGNEVMLIRARGKGYTARWVWRKPEAKPCTEAYILRTRRGGLVKPA